MYNTANPINKDSIDIFNIRLVFNKSITLSIAVGSASLFSIIELAGKKPLLEDELLEDPFLEFLLSNPLCAIVIALAKDPSILILVLCIFTVLLLRLASANFLAVSSSRE